MEQFEEKKAASTRSRHNLTSAPARSRSSVSRPTQKRPEGKKRDAPASELATSSQMRKKSAFGLRLVVVEELTTRSSISALTSITADCKDEVLNFKKITEEQKGF